VREPRADPSAREVAIARALRAAGVDFATDVPCALVWGIVESLARSGVTTLSVTREEEGVGICAGAALTGRLPVLLLQNSGLGNCGNALASLSTYYRLPLVLVVGWRGGPAETVDAQRPMGRATADLLRALEIPFVQVGETAEVARVGAVARRAHREDRPVAVLLRPEAGR
jgi:sulfopyruvate decarboxylase subunit alpha